MTFLGIQQLVNSVTTSLGNLGATLAGDGSIVIGGATNQLTGLLNQLNSMVQSDVTTPLDNLSDQVKNLSNQIYSACNRLNSILNQQQACLLLNAETVLAGIQTIVSQFKNGIPIIKKDAPRVNYFQFDGHTPALVPKSGGRVTVFGYYLWPSSSLAPSVALANEAETSLIQKDLMALKSQDNNSFAFIMNPDTLLRYAGQTLEIRVTIKKKSWIFFTKTLGTYYLPITIPSSFNTQLQVAFHVQYTCQQDATQVLDYRPFNFDNSSCQNRVNVSHTETWNIPNNGMILQVVYQNNPDTRNDYSVNVTYAGNTITAAGWIDSPTCICPLFGCKLVHSTYWHAMIAPKVTYKVANSVVVDGVSSFMDMQPTETNFLLNLNSPCPNPTSYTYWFDITKKSGTTASTIYTSQRTTNGNFSDDFKGLSITSSFNPTPVNSQSQAVIKIAQPQCGL